eukprot:4871882-Prymnesium_polylepis.1
MSVAWRGVEYNARARVGVSQDFMKFRMKFAYGCIYRTQKAGNPTFPSGQWNLRREIFHYKK